MSDPNESDFGGTDHPMHKAPAGQGVEAPLSQETGGPAEMSTFDGRGNESVVVVGENEAGLRSQGTGGTREEAAADTRDPSDQLGEDFGLAASDGG